MARIVRLRSWRGMRCDSGWGQGNHRWPRGAGWTKLAWMGKFGSRVGSALVLAAVLMAPWVLVLRASLPHTARVSGWSTAWVGLDVLEALALLSTGLLVLRRDPRVSPVAAVAASLLLVDAWFDLVTAGSEGALALAVAMAVLVELPICGCCALIAAGAVGIARATDLLDSIGERASGPLARAPPPGG